MSKVYRTFNRIKLKIACALIYRKYAIKHYISNKLYYSSNNGYKRVYQLGGKV